MSCLNPLHQRLSGFALGELDRDRALEFVAHAELCGSCARDLELYADLVTLGAGTIVRPAGTLARWRKHAPRVVFVLAAGFVVLGVIDQLVGPSLKPSYAELVDRSVPAGPAADEADPFAEEFAALLARPADGDFAALALELDPFLDLHPDHAAARFQRAIARRELGNLEGARADLRVLVDGTQGPLHDEALWVLANLELGAGETAAALQALAALESVGGDVGARASELADRVRAAR